MFALPVPISGLPSPPLPPQAGSSEPLLRKFGSVSNFLWHQGPPSSCSPLSSIASRLGALSVIYSDRPLLPAFLGTKAESSCSFMGTKYHRCASPGRRTGLGSPREPLLVAWLAATCRASESPGPSGGGKWEPASTRGCHPAPSLCSTLSSWVSRWF